MQIYRDALVSIISAYRDENRSPLLYFKQTHLFVTWDFSDGKIEYSVMEFKGRSMVVVECGNLTAEANETDATAGYKVLRALYANAIPNFSVLQ